MLFFNNQEKFSFEKVKREIKLVLPAQNAIANLNLNPTLGQHGINSFEFNKKFTELSLILKKDTLLRVKIFLMFDKTFKVFLINIPSGFLINEQINVVHYEKLNMQMQRFILLSKIYQLARISKILNHTLNLKKYIRIYFGILKSMHVKIIDDL